MKRIFTVVGKQKDKIYKKCSTPRTLVIITEYLIRFAFCQAAALAAGTANWQHCQRQSKASKCKQRIRIRIRIQYIVGTHDSARGDKCRAEQRERES